MIVKLLAEHHLKFLSLKGGRRGSSESTLVKMSNWWKSHALVFIGIMNHLASCWIILSHSIMPPTGLEVGSGCCEVNLGLTFSSTCTWTEYVNNISLKA